MAGEEHFHLAGDGLFLGGVEDGFDHHGNGGVAGLEVGGLKALEGEGELFVSRGATPEDAHDGEAVGLADIRGELDFTAHHLAAMRVQEPLDGGLHFVGGDEIGGLGGDDGEAGFLERVFEKAHALVADHVCEADAGVGGAIPWESILAEVYRQLAAGIVLARPEAKAGVVVDILPRVVAGGVGLCRVDHSYEVADLVAFQGLMIRVGEVVLTAVCGLAFLNSSRNPLSFQQPGIWLFQ